MDQRASDDELIQAARNGDRSAFAQLVQCHRPWVWQLITAIVHDHAYAEDLTQEVFYQVYQHLDGYLPQGKFVAWLKRIAVNRARNFLRDHGREIAAGAHILPAPAAVDKDLDPQAVLMSRLLRQEVRAALGALNDEQRQVLVRHYFGGQSIQAIAESLHCPAGTVKSRLFNGRRQLRQTLLALGTGFEKHNQEGVHDDER
jgi:RNA polymerase sigma-70 factor (ECF subfamily)